MKKIISIIAVSLIAATTLFAQSNKTNELAKIKAESNAVYQKAIKAKPTKEAVKEAKKLLKEGWTVQAGERSIEQQINSSFIYGEEVMLDEENNMTKRFIIMGGMSTAGTFNAAQAAARANTQVELASLIKTQIVASMETAIDNQQSSDISAVTIDKFHQRARSIVDETLTHSIPVVTVYRRVNNNFEVQVRIAFDKRELVARIIRNMKEKLDMEGDILDTIVEDVFCNKM